MNPDTDTPRQAPPDGGFLAGARRSIAMGALAGALLLVGGSAVALAADPSATPEPSATTQPSDGGTTAPETAPGATTPRGPGYPGTGDCPADDGSGSGSGTTPDAGTTAPAPDDTTPTPSLDTSDV